MHQFNHDYKNFSFAADQNYKNISYDDPNCETVNYENVTTTVAEKQRNCELSPNMEPEVTHRTLPH